MCSYLLALSQISSLFYCHTDHKFWTSLSAQKENLKFEAILQPSVWMAQRSPFLILILCTIWSFIALRVVVGQTVLFKNGLFTPSLAAAGFKT